jgi:hypothetical protein
MVETVVSFLPLLLVLSVVGLLIYFARLRHPVRQIENASRQTMDEQSQIIIRTFKGSQAEATRLFKVASIDMAAEGYFPTSQSWVPGQ